MVQPRDSCLALSEAGRWRQDPFSFDGGEIVSDFRLAAWDFWLCKKPNNPPMDHLTAMVQRVAERSTFRWRQVWPVKKEVGGLRISFSQSGCGGSFSVEPHLQVLHVYKGLGISLRGSSPKVGMALPHQGWEVTASVSFRKRNYSFV